MKNLFLTSTLLVTLFSSVFANETTTLKADYLCQQEDGDLWVEAAIVSKAPIGYELIVIKHDTDTESDQIIHRATGFSFLKTENSALFEDEEETTLLIKTQNNVGHLTLIENDNMTEYRDLTCYTNVEIKL